MSSEPLKLEVTFTDEIMDQNRNLGKLLRDISQFLSKVAARYVTAEKCDIHHPIMGTLINTSVALRQAGDMADPPVVLNVPGAMPPRGRA